MAEETAQKTAPESAEIKKETEKNSLAEGLAAAREFAVQPLDALQKGGAEKVGEVKKGFAQLAKTLKNLNPDGQREATRRSAQAQGYAAGAPKGELPKSAWEEAFSQKTIDALAAESDPAKLAQGIGSALDSFATGLLRDAARKEGGKWRGR